MDVSGGVMMECGKNQNKRSYDLRGHPPSYAPIFQRILQERLLAIQETKNHVRSFQQKHWTLQKNS